MTARYYGKKTVRNEFRDVVNTFDPCVNVSFKEAEAERARNILDSIGYAYDVFLDGDMGCAYVYVEDKEDAAKFMAAWKEAKRTGKKGA